MRYLINCLVDHAPATTAADPLPAVRRAFGALVALWCDADFAASGDLAHRRHVTYGLLYAFDALLAAPPPAGRVEWLWEFLEAEGWLTELMQGVQARLGSPRLDLRSVGMHVAERAAEVRPVFTCKLMPLRLDLVPA